MKNKPLIIAHRGYSGKFLENTMIAFLEAIKAQSQMIEFDVHLTSDLELVITHDYHLGRTVKAKGNVDDYTLFDLQKLGCSSLREVLTAVNKKVALNIELKHETLKTPLHTEIMALKVLALINEMNYQSHVVISSFDESILKAIFEIDPSIRLGVLDHYPQKGLKLKLASDIKAYSYHPNFLKLDSKIVSQIRSKNLLIYPYTANTVAEFKKLIELKVDGIITNEVLDLRTYLLTY